MAILSFSFVGGNGIFPPIRIITVGIIMFDTKPPAELTITSRKNANIIHPKCDNLSSALFCAIDIDSMSVNKDGPNLRMNDAMCHHIKAEMHPDNKNRIIFSIVRVTPLCDSFTIGI